MKKVLMKLVFIVLLILSIQGIVFSQGKQVTVIGTGSDHQAALDDALRNAVEQAIGVLVDAKTLINNYQVVQDEIYTQSQGFVQEYTILKEEKSSGLVKIRANVTVNTEPNSALLNKLQRLGLIKRLNNPRIAVILPEYHIDHPAPDPAAETAIIKKLREAGFKRIIDPKQLKQIRYSKTLRALLNGDLKTTHVLATKYDVDYLIVGEAFSEYAGNILNSGVHSCRARVEAKLIHVDNGQIIATNGFHASGVDIAEVMAGKVALTSAGEMMGDYMVNELLNCAGETQKEICLLIQGVSSFAKLQQVTEALRKIPGMNGLYVRDYASALATVDLDYGGSIQVLAKEITQLREGLKVKEMTANTLTIGMALR